MFVSRLPQCADAPISRDDGGFRPMPWLPAFAIGHRVIDREHRHLMDQANAIGALIANGASRVMIRATALALLTDLEGHFRSEERLLARHDSRAEAHRMVHRLLRENLIHCLEGQPEADSRPFETRMRAAVLAIIGHILGHDLSCKAYVHPRLNRVGT